MEILNRILLIPLLVVFFVIVLLSAVLDAIFSDKYYTYMKGFRYEL